jgi:hypothetical protein
MLDSRFLMRAACTDPSLGVARERAAPLPQDDNLICYQSNLAANSLGEQNGGLSLTGPQDPGLIYPRGAVP